MAKKKKAMSKKVELSEEMEQKDFQQEANKRFDKEVKELIELLEKQILEKQENNGPTHPIVLMTAMGMLYSGIALQYRMNSNLFLQNTVDCWNKHCDSPNYKDETEPSRTIKLQFQQNE